MADLSVQNAELSFGDLTLFSGASFDINPGDKVGLIGANGTGKTSLLKIIMGELPLSNGAVYLGKNVAIGYMEQHACNNSEISIYEEVLTVFSDLAEQEKQLDLVNAMLLDKPGNIELINKQAFLREQIEQNGGLTYKSRASSALIGLGFPKEMHSLTCDKLSGGQRSKVSLAKLLLSGADLILLDEPTNHLDIESVEWLEDYLLSFKGSALIISHDRYFLDKITDKTLAIENKKIKLYDCPYTQSLQQREIDKQIALRHYKNTLDEVHRIEKIIEQQKRWNRERNIRTAEHKQKSIDRLLDSIDKPDSDEQTIRFRFKTPIESGNDVYTCQSISKSFSGKLIFENLDLLIKKHERVFLLGPNGCGKTTLFRIIVGQYLPDTGLKKAGESVLIGYFDQSLEGLHNEKTVLDEVWDKYRSMSQTEVRTALAAFLFKGDDVYKNVGNLSGGEKARVAILKLILGNYNFILLDEPTNHLDIASREMLEQALLNYEGTLFIISHDRYFINKLSTRILRLNRSGLEDYGNNYESYITKLKSANNEAVTANTQNKIMNEYKLKKLLESEKRKLITKIGRIEAEIEDKESEIDTAQKQLALPETASDYALVLEITQKIDSLTAAIEVLMEEWELCSAELEEKQAKLGDF